MMFLKSMRKNHRFFRGHKTFGFVNTQKFNRIFGASNMKCLTACKKSLIFCGCKIRRILRFRKSKLTNTKCLCIQKTKSLLMPRTHVFEGSKNAKHFWEISFNIKNLWFDSMPKSIRFWLSQNQRSSKSSKIVDFSEIEKCNAFFYIADFETMETKFSLVLWILENCVFVAPKL